METTTATARQPTPQGSFLQMCSLDTNSTSRSNKLASCGGHGTLEILEVTQALEAVGIPCCLVGTSALIYYGANRGRGDWHICVPTRQLDAARSLLTSEPFKHRYILSHPLIPQPRSLVHTFPRFKCDGVDLYFQLIPSEDCHFDCQPLNFVRSQKGLPYPKLEVYIQSLIDTHDMVSLFDVVDGTNVSEDWGKQNLDLTGTNDREWVAWKNREMRAHQDSWHWANEVETAIYSREDVWKEAVRGKEARLGFKHTRNLFATRFRLHGSADPWLEERNAA